MRRQRIICGLLILLLCAQVRSACSQKTSGGADGATPYHLNVAVDEVSLTFHAADVHGAPIDNLRLDELKLLDNGKPPRKIVAFQSMTDLPLRAGILIDKSESMEEHLPTDKAISIKYARLLLRQQTDQAFVMDFASHSGIAEPWTSDAAALVAAIGEGRWDRKRNWRHRDWKACPEPGRRVSATGILPRGGFIRRKPSLCACQKFPPIRILGI